MDSKALESPFKTLIHREQYNAMHLNYFILYSEIKCTRCVEAFKSFVFFLTLQIVKISHKKHK